MAPAVQLRWQYSPIDFFEEVFDFKEPGYELIVDSGAVVATIEQVALETDPVLRERVELQVENLFLVGQLQSHQAYDLSRPNVFNLNSDGSIGVVIECSIGRAEAKGLPADLIYTRAGGAIADSKQERIRKKRLLVEASARHGVNDQTLSQILRSYGRAVRDPHDELVHLYEVRDALATRFGGKAAALSKLRLSNKDWNRLGQLCNELPLKQGRHRGQTTTALRDGTKDELAEARLLATVIIEAYMKFIDATRQQPTPH